MVDCDSPSLIKVDATVKAQVDVGRRRQIAIHHTATHVLNLMLRQVIAPDKHWRESGILQAGSHVDHDRLRFDFTVPPSYKATRSFLDRLEDRINALCVQGHRVSAKVMQTTDLGTIDPIALFDDKYGDQARVVQVDGVALNCVVAPMLTICTTCSPSRLFQNPQL